MIDFVKTAINLNSQSKCGKFDDLDGKRTLNYQWNDNSKYTGKLKSMIAMVDTSGSMSCDNCIPLYSAIGLGCRIAEKSSIGKRVLTFSSNPSWVNLSHVIHLQIWLKKFLNVNGVSVLIFSLH